MSIYRLERSKVDFMNGTPIKHFYPIVLANGAIVEEFSTVCNRCDSEVPADHFRGKVYMLNNNNTIVNQGVGFCEKCQTIWPIVHRVKTHDKTFRCEWVNESGLWVQAIAGYEKTNIKFWIEKFQEIKLKIWG